MEEVNMKDIYTVVVEDSKGTSTYEFYEINNAIKVLRNEKENNPSSKVYIIDYYGDILNIK